MTVRVFASLALLIGIVGIAPAARAQSNNKVAAEALFRDARRLLDEGNYREACDKLVASERLDPAVGTLLNLGHCYEKMGRTASAWGTYREAITAAKLAGQAEREKSARRSADALEPTLPHLTITVSPDAKAAGVQVTRDGVAVVPEIWGTSVPVDPGDHVIAASASGHKAWSTTVTTATGSAQNVDVPSLERSEDEPATDGAVAPTVSKAGSTPAATLTPHDQPATPESRPFWNTQRTFAVIGGGVGIAGGVLAVVELMKFSSEKDLADRACPSGCADNEHLNDNTRHRNAAGDARTLGIVGTAVGGAALVAGVVLWFTAPSASPSSGDVALAAAPTPGGLTVSLHGVL